jgi:hypothetical protein
MRPGGVQSIGDERGHTHVHWAAQTKDTQTKVLQERSTHGKSSQVRPGGHGSRKPGDTQREGVDQFAVDREGGPVSASGDQVRRWTPDLHSLLQDLRMTEWMMRSLAATLMRGDTSIGRQV